MSSKKKYKKYAAKSAAAIPQKDSRVLGVILSIIIFTLAVLGVENYNQFTLFDDEFGYWTGSAYFTGTDWSEISAGIPYYSYGYGLLILTPIRILLSTAPMMYRAAIVINSLLLVAGFWIARYVTRKLFPDINKVFCDFLCFLCQVYPAYILFSHIAWAECLLIFTFWVFVWLSLRVIEKPSIWNHIGIAFNIMALYVIHQRTLAVSIATVMIMIWLFIVEPERRKDIIIFSLSFGALVFVHSLIKTDLQDRYFHNASDHHRIIAIAVLAVLMVLSLFFVDRKRRKVILGFAAVVGAIFCFYTFWKLDLSGGYVNNGRVSVNELSGQMGKLQSILTLDGFVNLLYSIMGKWFYLAMSTFLMIWWSAQEYFSQSIRYVKDFHTARKNHELKTMAGDRRVWYIWLLLAIAGNFMIAAIYMIDTTRNDILFYGRYTEYMIGIYIIIGVMAFLRDTKWIRKVVIYLVIAGVSGWLCQNFLDDIGLTNYQAYHAIYTTLFLQRDMPTYDDVIYFTIFAIIACLVVVVLLKLKLKRLKNFDWLPKALIPLPMTLMFCWMAYSMVFGVMLEKQNLRIINIQNLVFWLQEIDPYEQYNVYYCKDTESRYWSESFQFLLKDNLITLIDSSQIDPTEEAFYITGDDFVDNEWYNDLFYCVKRSYQFALNVPEGTELAERAKRVKGE